MSRSERDPDAGCGGCLAVLFVIGASVAAAMALAALVDPFSWMPPIDDVFADCPPAPEVNGSCDLSDRYPGFWLHVIVNLAYAVTAPVLLGLTVWAVVLLRSARAARFEDAAALERYRAARNELALFGGATAVLAVLPVLLALA